MTDQIIMFISQLFNGLKIGSVYALVALGYTMVYGIIRLINFAHGDFIMVGAYVLMLTIPAIVAMGLPAWVAVIPAILVCVAVGVTVGHGDEVGVQPFESVEGVVDGANRRVALRGKDLKGEHRGMHADFLT